MRTRLLPALLLVLGLAAAPALAADAGQTITDLGARTLDALSQKGMSQAEREKRFRELWEEGFDVPYIARSVAGQYWRGANDQQRQNFVKALDDYIVRIYSQRFSDYHGENFKVLKSRSEGDGAYVNSQVIRPSGAPPVKIDWRLRKSGDGYKIIDVIVEGISMVTTQRDEFGAVIQRNGGQLDALTNILREKAG